MNTSLVCQNHPLLVREFCLGFSFQGGTYGIPSARTTKSEFGKMWQLFPPTVDCRSPRTHPFCCRMRAVWSRPTEPADRSESGAEGAHGGIDDPA
jgi:hypothetical protein